MTNSEIVMHLNKLHEMSEREKKTETPKFSITTGYVIRKNISVLEQYYKPYLESLQALQRKYLNKEEIEFQNANERKEYERKLNELLNIDNPDVAIHKIAITELEKCNNLTMEDQDALFFMIEE